MMSTSILQRTGLGAMRALATGSVLVVQLACLCFADLPPDVLAEFDVNPRGDLLILPVRLNGRAYPFVIDTGCRSWLFDESLRHLLGKAIDNVRVSTAEGDTTAERYSMPPAQVRPLEVPRNSRALCRRYRDDVDVAWDVFGIVGTDFLRDKIFRVDFDRGKLQFLKRIGRDAGRRFRVIWAGHWLPSKAHRPYLAVDVPGAGKEGFLIDTGYCSFDSGDMRKSLFDRLAANGTVKLVRNHDGEAYSPFGGLRKYQLAIIDELAIGPFRHRELMFSNLKANRLGLGYFSRFVVTFDFAHSAIYLKPGQDYARRDQFDLGKLRIGRHNGETRVSDVDPCGPAGIAGLRDDDEIIQVDGVLATGLSIFEICRMFATPGNRYVRFVRPSDNRTEREATIILADANAAEENDGGP